LGLVKYSADLDERPERTHSCDQTARVRRIVSDDARRKPDACRKHGLKSGDETKESRDVSMYIAQNRVRMQVNASALPRRECTVSSLVTIVISHAQGLVQY
jgi:hypothetical protein